MKYVSDALKLFQEFILEGLKIYHSFNLGQKNWSLKKLAYFLEINGKWLIIQGVKKHYCQTSCVFLAIFEGSSRKKTDATSSNQFLKMYNVDPDLYIFL